MKTFWILLFAIVIFSCKRKPDTTQNNSDVPEVTTYSYKVAGLSDSIVADSVWKIMFVYSGVEQLVLDNKDSLLVFTVSSSFDDLAELEEEIEKRGAKILEKLNNPAQ